MLKPSLRNHLFITVTLALVLLMIALSGTLFAQVAPPVGQSQHIEAGQTPDGLSAAKWDSIQAQIAAGKYRAYAAEAGGYGSSNPAHGWQIAYGVDGLTTLTPRNLEAAPWQWGLQLTGYGYGRLSGFDTPARLEANGPNLTYQWDASLSEWWHNTAAGLEQGFTVAQRPGAGDGRPLVLEMAVRSNLTPVQRGQAIAFVDKSGATVLTYDKLHVTDANGRGIPAHLSFTPVAEGRGKGTIRIVVEDGHATYPLTIDPLVQQAYLKASNTGADDNFGYAVAISGDTVVVGAYSEDSNTTGVNGDEFHRKEVEYDRTTQHDVTQNARFP